MTFADLVAGDEVFVDANTLIYHCTGDPIFGSACTNLLDRIGRQEVVATTSTHILLEVGHRPMTPEAAHMSSTKWESGRCLAVRLITPILS